MNNAVIVACPLCGALGKAGEPCEFCGATVPLPKESTPQNTSVVVDRQTIPAEEFAKRVAKYHNVSSWRFNLAIARIGELCGVINRNGELVIPLNYKNVFICSADYCWLDRDIYDLKRSLLHRHIWRADDQQYTEMSAMDGLDGQVLFLYKEQNRSGCGLDLFDIQHDKCVASQITGVSTLEGIKVLPQYNGYSLNNNMFLSHDGVTVRGVEIALGQIKEASSKEVINPGEDVVLRVRECKNKYQNNNKGCAVLLLPLLALGSGAIFGVIELIKVVFC